MLSTHAHGNLYQSIKYTWLKNKVEVLSTLFSIGEHTYQMSFNLIIYHDNIWKCGLPYHDEVDVNNRHKMIIS